MQWRNKWSGGLERVAAHRPPELVVQTPRLQLAASHLKHKKSEVAGPGTSLLTLCWGKTSRGSLYQRPGELDSGEGRGKMQNTVGSGAGFEGLWRAGQVAFWNFLTLSKLPNLCVGSVSKIGDKHQCLLVLAGLW